MINQESYVDVFHQRQEDHVYERVARLHVDAFKSDAAKIVEAYHATQNIHGSWSMKYAGDANQDLDVAGATLREGKFIGLRSTTFPYRDLLIVDGHSVFGEAAVFEDPVLLYGTHSGYIHPNARLSEGDFAALIEQCASPVTAPAVTLLAQALSATSEIMSEQGFSPESRTWAGDAFTGVALRIPEIVQAFGTSATLKASVQGFLENSALDSELYSDPHNQSVNKDRIAQAQSALDALIQASDLAPSELGDFKNLQNYLPHEVDALAPSSPNSMKMG